MLAPLLSTLALISSGLQPDGLEERQTLSLADVPAVREVEIVEGGALHVFARSDESVPRISVQLAGQAEPVEALGQAGGKSAYVRLAVEAGQRARIEVHADSGADVEGSVLFGWALAVETAAIRSAIADARAELAEIQQLRRQKWTEEARERLAWQVEILLDLRGVGTSELAGDILAACTDEANVLGTLDVARMAQEGALASRERLLPPDNPYLLLMIESLAIVHLQAEDLEEALALFERVLEGRRRTYPPGHVDIPIAMGNIATTLRSLRRYDEAVRVSEEAVELLEASRPADDPNLALARGNLGTNYMLAGDAPRGRALLEVAYDYYLEHFGVEDRMFQVTQQNYGLVLGAVGDLPRAAELAERVYEYRRANLPPEHPALLAVMTNLITARESIGDHEGARVVAQALVEVLERSAPRGDRDRVLAKRRLAQALRELGEVGRALAMDEELLVEVSEGRPDDDEDVLLVKSQLALSKGAAGDLRGALALEREVLAGFERILPAGDWKTQTAQLNLGATLQELGEYAESGRLLDEIFEIRRALPRGHAGRISVTSNLATVRFFLGDAEGQRAMLDEMLGGIAEHARELRAWPPRLARADARQQYGFVSLAVRLDEARGLHAAQTFEALEALRHVSTASSEVAWAAARNPELAQLRDRVGSARRVVQELCLQGPDSDERLRWEQNVLDSTRRKDQAEGELFRALGEVGVGSESPAPERIGDALDPNTALVSFFRAVEASRTGGVLAVEPQEGESSASFDRFIAFVVSHDGSVRKVDLGSGSEVEALVERWRASVGTPIHARSAQDGQVAGDRGVTVVEDQASADTEPEVSRALRRLVLDPCLAVLPESGELERLHVVLDDALHLVPLDALSFDDGVPVGERIDVHVETSVARLISEPRGATGSVLLALGGVDYGAAAGPSSGGRDGSRDGPRDGPLDGSRGTRARPTALFQELNFTGPEVEAIATLFEETQSEPEVVDATVLVGGEATARAFVKAAGSARWLHIATHGWFAGDAADRALRGFAPETLCGLALAGANSGASSDRASGLMTAEELAALDLSGCELAVLSACETNVGIRAAGQGVQSLQSALHAAGARTTVTSLWRVDDEATRRLMELFYRGMWQEGRGKRDALWAAKRTLANEGHPVRHWAGWVLAGDPD